MRYTVQTIAGRRGVHVGPLACVLWGGNAPSPASTERSREGFCVLASGRAVATSNGAAWPCRSHTACTSPRVPKRVIPAITRPSQRETEADTQSPPKGGTTRPRGRACRTHPGTRRTGPNFWCERKSRRQRASHPTDRITTGHGALTKDALTPAQPNTGQAGSMRKQYHA